MAKRTPEPIILLVEDHIPLLRNLAFLLTIAGYEVLTAANGQEALNILQKHAPDLIISDVDMPRMDGFELLARVRNDKRHRTVPFVIISDRYGLEDITRSLDLGADDYVPKPFDLNDVLYAVDRLLPRIAGKLRDTA
jgi:DNA-binding response OmpR family regulator